MTADTKNSKNKMSIFSPEPLGIFGCNFIWSISGTMGLKNKEKNL